MILKEASEHFGANPRQEAAALALGEAFDITSARDRRDFSVWVAKPHEQVAERFGLQQEVLVLYSSYPQTDARTLTAIEGLLRSAEYKDRLDRVLVLLIHNGGHVATIDLARKSSDRVIVPIHADHLRSSSRGDIFVRSVIAERLGSTDLFGMSSAITSDKYLFGRDAIVRDLAARSLVHGQNSGVFGLRKTGKTSVLFALQRQAPLSTTIAYIDCQSPGAHAARWWQALARIAERIGCPQGRDYSEASAASDFAADVDILLRQKSRVVLMLDEIEYMTSGLSGALGSHWDHDFVPFWQTIRATHQETQGRLTFIVAGVNPASVERSHFGPVPNPIFQLAAPRYLEPLDNEAVRRMVRSIGRYLGLHLDEAMYPYLQQKYGGHPYLIRVACSELWRRADTTSPIARSRLSMQSLEAASAGVRARLAQPIKDILLSLVWWYPEEYDLLQILAEGDAAFVKDYLDNRPESMAQFAKYGVLRESDAGFAIADIQEFLTSEGDLYKREVSPFRRGDLPPELLPEVPDLDVLGELFEKRSQIEILLRRAIALYLGVKVNWDGRRLADEIAKAIKPRPDRPKPQELFIGRSAQDALHDLYTSDLKSVIVEHWDTFRPLFDGSRQRFEMNMDTLNIARRVEAHTKPVTVDEQTDFRNSYAWLLARLGRLPQ